MPNKKLHFIDHEEHGYVYPIMSFDPIFLKRNLMIASLSLVTAANATILFSLFVNPVLLSTPLAFLSHPAFAAPMSIANYLAYLKVRPFFWMKHSYVTNMYLKPNGR